MSISAKLRKAIRTYPDAWLECRFSYRHDLQGLRVQDDARAREYRTTAVCSRCGTVKRQTITYAGVIIPREDSYVRPEGYDLPEELIRDVPMRQLWRLERIRRLLVQG